MRDLPQYGLAVVTFTDFLGFRALVANTKSAEDHPYGVGFINAILESLSATMGTEEFDGHRINYASNLRSYAFSDSVVRTAAVNEQYLTSDVALSEIIHVALIQCNLVSHSPILIRGALCFGQIFATEDCVFGPAFVNAYDLERQVSFYPRIIVESELARTVLKAHNDARDFLRMDSDGVCYIDYLFGASLKEYMTREVEFLGEGYLFKTLRHHANHIIDALSGRGDFTAPIFRDGRVRQKYIWLGRYHNDAVRRFWERVDAQDKLNPLLHAKYFVPEMLLEL
jgi:hypothetical protein